MKHSPHCVPPDEVGDRGSCICDGKGNPRCEPGSGCTECYPPSERICGCHACENVRGAMAWMNRRMIVCEVCGNKRCPHATDHRNACTNSNDSGQPGSAYV